MVFKDSQYRRVVNLLNNNSHVFHGDKGNGVFKKKVILLFLLITLIIYMNLFER